MSELTEGEMIAKNWQDQKIDHETAKELARHIDRGIEVAVKDSRKVRRFVDFDNLIYIQFDHSPGYAQWWVMLNLGHARAPDGKSSAIILQRFGTRMHAEQYKHDIIYGHAIIEQKTATDNGYRREG